jgi:hypothetical protein
MDPVLPGLSGFEEVGRGGFGIVYGAFDARFGRRVAVKIIRDSGLGRDVRARFERECLAIGSVSGHPNIVAVYDSGVTDGGDLYLVMEFLGGGSARQRLREQGPATPVQAVRVGIGLAGALETAHRAGIVHRDIKPENILYSDYDVPKLVDFGIARVQFGYQTRTGLLSATLNHAAPEVVGGSSPGSAVADVYSLVLYTLLAGQPPFYGGPEDSVVPLISRIVTQPAPDIAVTAGVPEHLARVVARGLAKDPGERYPSAAEFGAALQEANERLGGPPLPLPLTAPAAAGPGEAAGAVTGADPAALTGTHEGGDPERADDVDEADEVTHVSPVEALDATTDVQHRATTLADATALAAARTPSGESSMSDAGAEPPPNTPTGDEGRPARHRLVVAAAAAVALIVAGVAFGLSRLGTGPVPGAAAAAATGVSSGAASVDQAPGPASSSTTSTDSAALATATGTASAPPTVDPQLPAGGQQQSGQQQAGPPQGTQPGKQPGSTSVPAQPPPSANRPATLNLTDRSNDELVAVSFAVGVNDPDGDTVSVTVAGLPPGVAAAGASVSGTISQAASSTTTDRRKGLGTSTFTVTVTAVDSKGARTSGQFLWTVRDTHRLMPDYIGQLGCGGCGGLPDVAAITVPGFFCAYDPSGDGDHIYRQSIAAGSVIRWGQSATYWYGKNDSTCQRVAKGW